MTEPKWVDRVELHPFAEALAINTDQIMSSASVDKGRTWFVLFTLDPNPTAEDWIWMGVLWRNTEGILEVARRFRFKTIGQFNEGLAEHMRRAMEGEGHGTE